MKVFPDSDSGAPETAILNALEDAASLGADVVNLSLGSDNGFAETTPPPTRPTPGCRRPASSS